MIRDAVIHMQGEQPLVADLPTLPSAGDSCLVCTNMRTLDGKRPVFVDAVGSTFIIPLQHVRFIEIQPDGGATAPCPPGPGAGRAGPRRGRRGARRGLPAAHPRSLSEAVGKPGPTGRPEGRCYTRAAMTKNLVIVESPAKARTIERYLGPDYQVLASYGHVRDLPENPGKGKLGVDVEHEFAPDYVVPDDRRKQVDSIARAAARADTVYLATDLDREGEAIAWHVAEAAHIPDDKQQRVTFGEITEGAIRAAFAHPRRIDMDLVDAQQTRRIVDRLVGYTLSPLLSRKVRGGLSAGRVQSVAVRLVVERERAIEAFQTREYWTLVAASRGRRRDRPSRPTCVRLDAAPLEIPDEADARAPSRRTAGRHGGRPQGVDAPVQAQPGRALHHQHAAAGGEPQALLQPAAHDVRRPAPVRGPGPRRGPRGPHHLHAHRLDADGRRGHGRGPRGHRRALRGAVHDAQGPRLPHPHQGRPGGPRGHPADELRPRPGRRSPGTSSRRSCASTGSSGSARWRRRWPRSGWRRRPSSSTPIATACGPAPRGPSSTASRGSTPRAATTRPATRRRAGCRRSPRVTRPRSRGVEPTQHFTEPPPRFTEATLIKALEEHGIGRPSHVCGHDLDHRGSRLRQGRGPAPAPGAGGRHRHGPARGALRRVRGRRLHGAHGGAARRGGPRRARPGCRSCGVLRPPQGSRGREAPRAAPRRDFTTEATDEVCSDGHPMVIRLGRNGSLPGLLAVSRAQGDRGRCPARSRTPPLAGRRRAVPLVRRGRPHGASAGASGSSSGCSRYPDCDYIHKDGPPPPPPLPLRGHLPHVRPGPSRRRAAPAGPATSSGAARATRSATSRRTSSRLGALHDADAGRRRAPADGGLCLRCGAAVPLPEMEPAALVGLSLPGGPPDPAALAPQARAAQGRRADRAPATADRHEARGPAREPSALDRRVTGATALACATGARSRRATSRIHTRRAYGTAAAQYLDWLAGAAGRRLAAPRPADAAGLPRRPRGARPRPYTRSGRGSPPCARSTATPGARGGWSAIRGRPSPRHDVRDACRPSST